MMKSNILSVDTNRLVKYVKKNSVRFFAFALRIIILIAIGYVIIYPLLYMLVTSLISQDGFFNSVKVWIPESIDPVYNYKTAFELLDYPTSFKVTFFYEIISAFIEVAMCAITAYGFARFKFKGKNILIAILFLTILIPDMMIVLPRVANYSNLDLFGIFGLINKITGVDLRINMLDSPLAFYLPSFFSSGLKSGILIYIYIQFFSGLPYELEEAAYIDGAGPFRTFLSIAVPSSGVVFITVIVFSLIWHWNDYFLSSMYLSEEYPLAFMVKMLPTNLTTIGLVLNSKHPETMAIQLAGCVMFIAPMLAVYMVLQRWFIESIDRVGITG